MKRLISLLLCLMMILMTFSACSEEEPKGPVTITIMTEGEAGGFEYFLNNMLYTMYEDQIQIRYEKLSSDQHISRAERESELQRVRTEIIAGDGPDIFLLPTKTAMLLEGLFPSVSEAMYNGVFLPLDEYIAESEIFDPEDYIAPLLDAGKTDRGQMVIPLMYDLPTAIVDKSFTDAQGSNKITLDELLQTDNERILARCSAILSGDHCQYLFPQIADYSTGKLLITEEDIAGVYDEIGEISAAAADIADREYIAYFEISEKYGFADNFSEEMLYGVSKYRDELSLLLVTDNEGKCTARITAFTAISANTEHPDEAFKVLELICGGYPTFGDTMARPSMSSIWNNSGIPAVKNAFTEKDLVDLELAKFLEDSVTAAEFECDLDAVIGSGRWKYQEAKKKSEEDGKEYISDLYTELKMHLAE